MNKDNFEHPVRISFKTHLTSLEVYATVVAWVSMPQGILEVHEAFLEYGPGESDLDEEGLRKLLDDGELESMASEAYRIAEEMAAQDAGL